MSAPRAVRGRLAPSPTGRLHLGHARSFLAAWWSARAAGGEIVLRIEDLDSPRCRPEYDDQARRDLEWLGLNWDGPVLRQSDDLAPYAESVERLLRDGAAYACTCSRREILDALSAPHASGEELRYPGTCRERWESPEQAESETGEPAGVRLRVPPGELEEYDELRGPFSGSPHDECGDFLLLRRDGIVAYQLAVVVDDARQGVTEVVRGDDLLPSTLRQALLGRALGLPLPRWRHLPLVHDSAERRLSKRDGDLELAELAAAGVDPRQVVAWAAATLGQLGPEGSDAAGGLWTAAERAPGFDWARVPTQAVRLPPDPLQALRRKHR